MYCLFFFFPRKSKIILTFLKTESLCVHYDIFLGIIILADERYAKPSKKNKLPPWVTKFFQTDTISISTDTAVHHARKFLMQSAQPVTEEELTESLYDKKKLDQLHYQWIKANPGASIARESFDMSQRLKRERTLKQQKRERKESGKEVNDGGGGFSSSSSSSGGGSGGGNGERNDFENDKVEFEQNQKDLIRMQKEAEEERLESQFSWNRMPKQLNVLGEFIELDLNATVLHLDDGDTKMKRGEMETDSGSSDQECRDSKRARLR